MRTCYILLINHLDRPKIGRLTNPVMTKPLSDGGERKVKGMAEEKSLRERIAELQLQLAAEEVAQQARERALEEESKRRPPRMRTAQGAVAALKEEDPDTQITVSMVRKLIRLGKVPYVPMGRKKLINMDTLIGYFRESEGLEYAVSKRGG